MSRRKLIETFEVKLLLNDPNTGVVHDNMISEWGMVPYPELSVLIVNLRFLALVHQTHHWTAMGDPFFGDHLLFERLYNSTSDEIDQVAEKTVGLGTVQNVDMMLQTSQLQRMIAGYGMSSTIPQQSELARRSMMAELNFLKAMDSLVCSLKESGTLTRGLDNMLAGIEDKHEGSVYLLKQRCLQGLS
jgi:DNA-binding ferritin-like protein